MMRPGGGSAIAQHVEGFKGGEGGQPVNHPILFHRVYNPRDLDCDTLEA